MNEAANSFSAVFVKRPSLLIILNRYQYNWSINKSELSESDDDSREF